MQIYDYYQKLYSLTEKQKELIENSDFDNLIKILEEKQKVIDKINEIDLKENLQKEDDPKKSLKKLKELMKEIKNMEENNEKKLRNKKENLAEKLKSINLKEKTRNGYHKKKSYEAKFIDKKS